MVFLCYAFYTKLCIFGMYSEERLALGFVIVVGMYEFRIYKRIISDTSLWIMFHFCFF